MISGLFNQIISNLMSTCNLAMIFAFSMVFNYTKAQPIEKPKIKISAFGEIYYSFDFANPNNHEKPTFIYNHKRHNEVNSNLLLLKANYDHQHVRGNIGFMAGNYAQYNLSNEPKWAQFIYEANIGIKLSNKYNIWLDAGIIPSHLGFESTISADCWTLTRSIVAENSPYYETGIKLGYSNQKENLNVALFILNGWQKISRPDYMQYPSFGLQLNYKPNENVIINYSNFIGSDKPDSVHALRTYHNIYFQYQASKKMGIIAGFDIGSDKYNALQYGIWYSPIAILRYSLNKNNKIALRAEYYHDAHEIIIPTSLKLGFQTIGISTNYDLNINKLVQWRFEAKYLLAKEKIFNNYKNENLSLTTNLSIKID